MHTAHLRKIYRYICSKMIQLVYPRRCPVCGDITEYGSLICTQCIGELHYIVEPCCKKCGQPVEDDTIEYCYDCNRKQHQYDAGKAVFLYQGAIKESLYRFKYANKREYVDFYANETVAQYSDWIIRHKIEAIIPVPLYTTKYRKRGYNQAELYARSIGRQMQIPVYTDILKRVYNTRPQKELNDKDRKNNLKNAFKCKKSIVQFKCILLVDDIYTTGSTVDAAAAELKRAGVSKVYTMCISIGRGF